MLQQIVSLWIGGSLGTIERLSLRSFVAQGHPVALYTYGAVTGVPSGVELRDAATIMPQAVAIANRYPNGSFALAADLFRLELQRRDLGLWVDVDVVAIRPVRIDGPFVAGRESDRFLNNAVLKVAGDSPLLAEWIAATRSGRVPRWLPFHRAPKAYLAETLGTRVQPADLPFGTFGPKAITALAERHGMAGDGQAIEVFYPLHPRDAAKLWDAELSLDAVITERTLAMHLWNEKLKELKQVPPPPSSILAQLLSRYPG